MFGKGIHLFTVFGFSVEIDFSWLFIAALVTWSLASGYFPHAAPGLSTATYWWMGVVGAAGLFASIVVHELSHSLVARQYGIRMRGIRLFIFGGVAQMDEEPQSPLAEFMMAIAGPIASVVIGVVSFVIYQLGIAAGWNAPVLDVFFYLCWINLLLAAFNLVPAFPLDGGRVLRSILWKINGNLKWATRIASFSGSTFAILLILLGVLSLFGGNVIGGMWWILLGLFLRAASESSYQQLLVTRLLGNEPVEHLMRSDVRTVSPSITVEELVEQHVYRHHFKMFPVMENGHLIGCVTTRKVKELPRDEWPRHSVGELSEPCSEDNSVPPSASAIEALKKMSGDGSSRLMVVEGDQLRGIVSLKDISRLISLKLELEE